MLTSLFLIRGNEVIAGVQAAHWRSNALIPTSVQENMTPWLAVCPSGTELDAAQRLWDMAGKAVAQVQALARFLQIPSGDKLDGPHQHELRLRLRACTDARNTRLPSASFATLAENPLQIPVFLCGPKSEAARQVRKLCKAAVKNGSWQSVLEKLEYIPIDDAPGEIVMAAHHGGKWIDPIWPALLPAGAITRHVEA